MIVSPSPEAGKLPARNAASRHAPVGVPAKRPWARAALTRPLASMVNRRSAWPETR